MDPAVLGQDEGDYSCMVKNSNGPDSDRSETLTFDIKPPPPTLIRAYPPPHVNPIYGKPPVLFICLASAGGGTAGAPSYIFFKDNVEVQNGPSNGLKFENGELSESDSG